jgi:SulP family sulfate permease
MGLNPLAAPAGAVASPPPHRYSVFEPYIPKSIVCLRDGSSRRYFISDLLAGLTVGVIALPLALAFAIGSHVKPEQGLYTAIVAGFLISLLGGSRVNIGGPTGAFVVIIAGIVDRYGYNGLALATLMAGVILIIMGLAKFGGMIKFIPYPVTTGFTAGIAVIIFSSQVKELTGMRGTAPSSFVGQWGAYLRNLGAGDLSWWAIGLSLGCLAVIALLRRFAPKAPGYLIAVVLATGVVALFQLDRLHGIETIGSRFGQIPRSLASPRLPAVSSMSWEMARSLIPDATTIALLAGIESLLCAVVADGMIGGRHKSNCELVAQGAANIGSIFFGGIPATGAIARTAANVKAGGRTPLAGMVHALVVLGFMLLLAPWAKLIPLCSLAAVLVVVAWGMSEKDHFITLFKAPRSDIAVLLTTFGLTVFAGLTVAVGVGMVLASMLFMRRMSEVTNVGTISRELEDLPDELTDAGDPNSLDARHVPHGVEVYEINGPFFFGVADRLKDVLRQVERPPKVFILRMRRVPAIDASGLHALDEFHDKCRRQHTRLLLAGVHAQPIFALTRYGLIDKFGENNLFGNIDDALNEARVIVGEHAEPRPAEAVPEVAREGAAPASQTGLGA